MAKKKLKNADYRIKSTLDHFIDQGAYPIRVEKEEADLIKKYLTFLSVKKLKTDNDKYVDFVKGQKRLRNYEVKLTKKGIPDNVLAVYWKFRYDELYQKIKYLSENY